MTDEDFMKYLKAKVIRETDGSNLLVNLSKNWKMIILNINHALRAYFLRGKFYSLLSCL